MDRVARCVRGICLAGVLAQPLWSHSPVDDVIAINILLELDSAAGQRAQAANATLRQAYPRGFALDATHIPHITVVQCYVSAKDLPKITGAVRDCVKSESIQTMKLQATHYAASPAGLGDIQSAVMNIDLTPELRRLHEKIVQAVPPWAVRSGDTAAFVPNDDRSPINPQILHYVDEFIPKSSGPHYQPHITLGLAPQAHIHQMESENFDAFSFHASGVAIYQVGDFGTARKRLKSF